MQLGKLRANFERARNMYSLVKNLLFQFSPEVSHELSLDWLGAAERLKMLSWLYELPSMPVEVMGLKFPNPVGLAAGLDKNGDYVDALSSLGFGFVEIGTVTPKPQAGNPKPRLFRLREQNAIINRMGFNNKGVEHLVDQVKKRHSKSILGINIGKNKVTPEERALSDYEYCMEAVYQYADYITVNISSPNTPGLRNLQFGETFNQLLEGVKRKQSQLAARFGRYVPVAIKIAPDMTEEETSSIAKTLMAFEIDGVIATNTTVARDGVENSIHAKEAGGLSGAPVRSKSTQTIKALADNLGGKIPIIGVGGVLSGADAVEKINAGASLVQIYSGFIYRGPGLIKETVEALKSAT